MIAGTNIREPIVLVIAYVAGGQIEIAISESCSVLLCFFQQERTVPFTSMLSFDVESTNPRIQVHPTYEIVCDQSCTAYQVIAAINQIPLRQRGFGINAITDAVVVDHHSVFVCPVFLKI